MLKKISSLLLLAFILLLSGCSDEWNDLVDTISGSGDDNPAPVQEEVAAVASSQASEAPSHQQNPGSTATLSTATQEAPTEDKATEEEATEEKATEEEATEDKATEEVAAATKETEETKETKTAPPKPKASNHFHHTTTASSDGGKSLVMCPGHVPNFDRCSVGNTDIPYHGYDTGRVIYWNMYEEPRGDIICVKGGKSYRYRADSTIVYGDC